MIRTLIIAALASVSAPAAAEGDELVPVSALVIRGTAYSGDHAPSKIRFVNVRSRPVKLIWIGFDGASHPYATIPSGQEVVQHTYVAHRWLIEDAEDGQPLQGFISTRSARRDHGATQIALIR